MCNSPTQTGNWSSDRVSSIASSNRFMLDSEDGCDLTLLVRGPNDKADVRIGVHRYVLCSRSPAFYQLLWVGKASKDKKLKIVDSSADAVKQLVRFLYCDEANITASNVIDVLSAARRYQVTPLEKRCKEFIVVHTTVSDACKTMEQCIAVNDSELVDAILDFVSLNAPAVLHSEAFLHSPPEVVRRIVGHDELDIVEIELFEACVSWAQARCATGNRGADDATTDLMRCYLEPIIPYIRFPIMSAEEFATRVVPLNLLTDSESCNIFKYYSCPSKPPKRFLSAIRLPQRIGMSPVSSASPVPLPRQMPSASGQMTAINEEGCYPDINSLKVTDVVPTAPILEQTFASFGAPPKYKP